MVQVVFCIQMPSVDGRGFFITAETAFSLWHVLQLALLVLIRRSGLYIFRSCSYCVLTRPVHGHGFFFSRRAVSCVDVSVRLFSASCERAGKLACVTFPVTSSELFGCDRLRVNNRTPRYTIMDVFYSVTPRFRLFMAVCRIPNMCDIRVAIACSICM